MTLTIQETIAVDVSGFSFAGPVLEGDVAIVVGAVVGNGLYGYADIIPTTFGWNLVNDISVNDGTHSITAYFWWRSLHSGQDTFDWSEDGSVAGVSMVAARLHSSVISGLSGSPSIDGLHPSSVAALVTGGPTASTGSALVGWSAAQDGTGSIGGSGWSTLAAATYAALYTQASLEQASGTTWTLQASGGVDGHNGAGGAAFSPWSQEDQGTPPGPPAALLATLSSFAWIID